MKNYDNDIMNFYFSEGLASVELNNKYGFIDKEGKEIIPLKYDRVTPFFFMGSAEVMLNDKWFYINKKGERSAFPEKLEKLIGIWER